MSISSPSWLLAALLPAVAGLSAHAATGPAFAATPAGKPRTSVCAPQASAARSADVQAICAQARRWIEVFEAGDIEGLMTFYMPDAEVALHGQPKLVGAAAIRAFFAPVLAARPKVDFRLDVEQVRVDGDSAWLMSRYWYVSEPRDGGASYTDAGRSLLVYRRDRGASPDGEWKILVDIDQGTPDVTFPIPPGAH